MCPGDNFSFTSPNNFYFGVYMKLKIKNLDRPAKNGALKENTLELLIREQTNQFSDIFFVEPFFGTK